MGKTKILEFNLGDIVKEKYYPSRTMLVVEKITIEERDPADLYKYYYVALDILSGDQYYISSSINNKHYKIVG